MSRNGIIPTTRRAFFEMLAGSAGLAALGPQAMAQAQSRNGVLVLGMDISDTITYDPATNGTGLTPPAVLKAAYDTLVTMTPGDYVNLKPALATAWARTPDGRGWRLTLREGVKFASGNPMTVEDVKYSFDRVINIKAQPALYIANIESTAIADATHFDILLKDPARPILNILCCYSFVIYDHKVLEAQGADVSADAANKDKAGAWLNQHSCGTGPYTMTSWERNGAVQFERNPHYWGGTPPFQRVIIRHLAEPSAQLLAIQRGDIDAAFNLVPEQIATLKGSQSVRVEPLPSLDLVYLALTANAEFSKALAVREAREAVGWAIDYDGIRDSLLGGAAQHPATILPIGTLGATTGGAREFGMRQDLAKAKALLEKAGFPEGFPFKLSYGTGNVAGVSFAVIAQKLQSDLARVGIRAHLDPLDPVTLRTQYNTAKSTAVIQSWDVTGVDNWIWALAATQRVAARLHYKVPDDILKLADQGDTETDEQRQAAVWVAFQKRMVEEAYLLPLFQPTYQIAVSNRIRSFPLTAAGWFFEVAGVKA